jgi:hypothetical protein
VRAGEDWLERIFDVAGESKDKGSYTYVHVGDGALEAVAEKHEKEGEDHDIRGKVQLTFGAKDRVGSNMSFVGPC